MSRFAFDIETCPLPIETFSERQMRRYRKELDRLTERDPDRDPDDASRFVRSLHPWLGWVCCVSVASPAREPSRDSHLPVTRFDPYATRSWTAATPDAEEDLLARFWADLQNDDGLRRALVVSFNGKQFDSPFLKARSLRHAIQLPPIAGRLLSTHRWRGEPHFDLMHAFHPQRVALADACDLLGVESPKGEIDGSQVASAVEAGRIDDVARYCEGDTRATLECYDVLNHLCPQ
jgi:hypothetical protein